jgi:hypothetical protein
MKTGISRRKKPPSLDFGADRAVKAVVLLAVTFVLLIIGFSGASVDITLPRPAGWIYIGIVIIVSASAFIWLFRADANRNKGKPSRSRTVSPKSKQARVQ